MRSAIRVMGAAIICAFALAAPAGGASGAIEDAIYDSGDFYAAQGTLGCRTVGGAAPLLLVCSGRGVEVTFAAGRDGRGQGYTGAGCRMLRGGYVSWCASGRLPGPGFLTAPVFLRSGDSWRYVTGTGRVRLVCQSRAKFLRCRNEAGRTMAVRVSPRTVRAS